MTEQSNEEFMYDRDEVLRLMGYAAYGAATAISRIFAQITAKAIEENKEPVIILGLFADFFNSLEITDESESNEFAHAFADGVVMETLEIVMQVAQEQAVNDQFEEIIKRLKEDTK